MVGGVLIAMAVLFALRIPENMHSTDPKADSKMHADIFLVVVCGIGGGTLVWPRGNGKAQ